jgi:hypothetical protein
MESDYEAVNRGLPMSLLSLFFSTTFLSLFTTQLPHAPLRASVTPILPRLLVHPVPQIEEISKEIKGEQPTIAPPCGIPKGRNRSMAHGFPESQLQLQHWGFVLPLAPSTNPSLHIQPLSTCEPPLLSLQPLCTQTEAQAMETDKSIERPPRHC